MIDRLTGQLIEKRPPTVIIDVHGVGYACDVPMNGYDRLPEIGQITTLLTHVVIREDAHHLYGFLEANERELFRTLIKVNGIGPKLALSILSGLNATQLIACIQQQDSQLLTTIPGIGKKTAQRLLLETADRLQHTLPSLQITTQTPSSIPMGDGIMTNSVLHDAINALISLGYKPNDATRMIKMVYNDDTDLPCEQLIKRALQHYARGQ